MPQEHSVVTIGNEVLHLKTDAVLLGPGVYRPDLADQLRDRSAHAHPVFDIVAALSRATRLHPAELCSGQYTTDPELIIIAAQLLRTALSMVRPQRQAGVDGRRYAMLLTPCYGANTRVALGYPPATRIPFAVTALADSAIQEHMAVHGLASPGLEAIALRRERFEQAARFLSRTTLRVQGLPKVTASRAGLRIQGES